MNILSETKAWVGVMQAFDSGFPGFPYEGGKWPNGTRFFRIAPTESRSTGLEIILTPRKRRWVLVVHRHDGGAADAEVDVGPLKSDPKEVAGAVVAQVVSWHEQMRSPPIGRPWETAVTPEPNQEVAPTEPDRDQGIVSKEVRPVLARSPVPAEQPQPSAEEAITLIERLASLRDSGVLTDEEFATKKAELLRWI